MGFQVVLENRVKTHLSGLIMGMFFGSLFLFVEGVAGAICLSKYCLYFFDIWSTIASEIIPQVKEIGMGWS